MIVSALIGTTFVGPAANRPEPAADAMRSGNRLWIMNAGATLIHYRDVLEPPLASRHAEASRQGYEVGLRP